jgi:hypothetical protein
MLNVNPRPSIFGRRLGLAGRSLIIDNRVAVSTWEDRGAHVVDTDHFRGKALRPEWLATLKGSDGSAAVPAIVADTVGGYVGLTSGAGSTLTMAVNGSELVGSRNFDNAKGGLEFGAALQMSRITNACVFIGFADNSTTLAMPFTISGGTLTANASDGHGFLFDTAATAATWKVVGVANTVKPAIIDTGVAPVAATDDLIKIEVDINGNLMAWLNGALVANAPGFARAAAGAKLTPTFAMFSRSAASYTAQADFISVGQDR